MLFLSTQSNDRYMVMYIVNTNGCRVGCFYMVVLT